MVDLTASSITELGNDSTEFYYLIAFDFATPIYHTNATFDITHGGNTYSSDAKITGLPKNIKQTLKMNPNGIRINMAGSNLTLQSVVLTQNYNNVDVDIYIYIPATADAAVIWSGVVDRVSVAENIQGNQNIITWSVISHWAGFDDIRGRVLSNDEQQNLYSGDTGFKFVGQLDEALKNWNSDDVSIPADDTLSSQIGAGGLLYGSDLASTGINHVDSVGGMIFSGSTSTSSSSNGGAVNALYDPEWRPLQNPPPENKPTDLNVYKLPSTNRRLPVVYGQAAIKGIKFFQSLDPSDNTILYVGYLLCEGEIDSIVDIKFKDRSYNKTPLKYVLSFIDSRTGTTDQVVSTPLLTVFGAAADNIWESTDRLRGCAYAVIKYNASDVLSGEPNPTFIVKGKKCYDPRDGTTAWTNNPVLHYRDYLTNTLYGKGIATSRIDDDVIKSLATYAETTVTDHDGGEGGTPVNIQLFAFNGAINTDGDIKTNIKKILLNMRGHNAYINGKYTLVIEKPSETSVYSFDESNMAGTFKFSDATARNKYSTVYYEILDDRYTYQKNIVRAYSASYLTIDNNVPNYLHILNTNETNYYRAINRAQTILKTSRSSYTIGFTAKKTDALKVDVGSIIDVSRTSHGWSGKLFRVLEKNINLDGEISFGCIEYTSTDYDWSVSTENVPPPDTYLPDAYNNRLDFLYGFNNRLYYRPALTFKTDLTITGTGAVSLISPKGLKVSLDASETTSIRKSTVAGNGADSDWSKDKTLTVRMGCELPGFPVSNATTYIGIGTYNSGTPSSSVFMGFLLEVSEIGFTDYMGIKGVVANGSTITHTAYLYGPVPIGGPREANFVHDTTAGEVYFYIDGVSDTPTATVTSGIPSTSEASFNVMEIYASAGATNTTEVDVINLYDYVLSQDS